MAVSPTYRITFLNTSPDEANQKAVELADWLKDAVPQTDLLQVKQERTNKDSQDFGATLVLLLGTAAATAVARGVQSWLAAHSGTTIEITDANGHIVATNINAKSASEIAKAWSERKVD
jgi:membrane-associated two-gene conflict system component 1 (EACC1)